MAFNQKNECLIQNAWISILVVIYSKLAFLYPAQIFEMKRNRLVILEEYIQLRSQVHILQLMALWQARLHFNSIHFFQVIVVVARSDMILQISLAYFNVNISKAILY